MARNPNLFEQQVQEWAEVLGLGDHNIKVVVLPHAQMQQLSETDEDTFAHTVTDWTRREHSIYITRKLLRYRKNIITMIVLDELAHVLLSPLSEFTMRYLPNHLHTELNNHEENVVTHIKRAFMRVYDIEIPNTQVETQATSLTKKKRA